MLYWRYMTVGEVMQKTALTVRPEMSWRDAAKLLLAHRQSSVPVVSEDGHLVGILSEKDLFRGLFPSYKEWAQTPETFLDFTEMEAQASNVVGKTVADVMTTRLITAARETPILKVGALMVASGIHHVPVVDGDQLIGMVGRGDIYRAILAQHFGIG